MALPPFHVPMLDANFILRRTYELSKLLLDAMTVVVFIASVKLCRRSYQPLYMKSLPIYFLVDVITEVIAQSFPHIMNLTYFIFMFFEQAYFSYFLSQIIATPGVRKLILALFLSFLILVLLSDIFIGHIVTFGIGAILEGLSIIVPCFLYFKRLFLQTSTIELKREPSFWMVTGILFYFLVLIPVIWFSGSYFYLGNYDLSQVLFGFNNFSQIISYTLFIKAMTCRQKKFYS
ncbi:MAG: hypothetical protein P4L51_23855 [Puia sp.]|nr:hypothetical protein [Puia sp.]